MTHTARITALALFCSAAALGGASRAAGAEPKPWATSGQAESPTASFVLRAKAVYPVTSEQPGPIEHGMIIVRDGRIVAVGRDLVVPPDLPVIDLRDEVVCPGFVAAASALGGQHSGPETVSGAYRALDAFDTYADYTLTLSRGTTTAHLDPGGHRLVSGLGAVVKLGGPPERRALEPSADLAINLGVFGPPLLVKRPFYASSDVPIEPGKGQRPDSRLGQYLELDERIAAATDWLAHPDAHAADEFDVHARTFAEAWSAKLPLRIQVRHAADVEGALALVQRYDRPACLVGLTEGDRLPAELATARLPLVLRMEQSYRDPDGNLGGDPAALETRVETAGVLARLATATPAVPVALAGAEGDRQEDLRLAAIFALRGGMAPETALAAITRVPAEILNVGARVGSLAPGKDADLLILTGDPLDINSYVRRVYVEGRVAFEAPATDALVVRAGTIWVGDGSVIRDGAVLMEKGKIQAIGPRVPHPPFARLIDAGPDSFLAPGFIDALGHLGLRGDGQVAGPDLPPHLAIGLPTREFRRVAQAGVTTVLLAPYRVAPNGARLAAIKTYGTNRDELVARELTGLRFSLRGQDPLGGAENIRKVLQAGQKYVETWKKYEEELAKWKESGGKAPAKPKEEVSTEAGKPDPLSGTWQFTVSGEPLPNPISGRMVLRLTGTMIEGRISDPSSGEEATLTGTLTGDVLVSLTVDVDTPFGKPVINATLDRTDHMAGKAVMGEFNIAFEATRTDKTVVEFKLQRKKRTKDGRPAAPKIDENLEPVRALLAGRIPAVVDAATAGEINAAVKLFVDEFKVPLVLLGADDAIDLGEQLVARKDKLGVVVPRELTRQRDRQRYTQVVDLSRQGLRVALQSDAEDAARNLPLMSLYAVRAGLGGDAALKALTIDAARMYKLDDRVGSLEVGKDADLLIFHGHPFDAAGRLERVIVGGREVPDEQ